MDDAQRTRNLPNQRDGPAIQADLKAERDYIFANLKDESDRGLVIIGAAYLDAAVGNLLASFFLEDRKAADDLLESERHLLSFAARTTLAYVLGLISKGEQHDLDIIRKTRNAFAHDVVASFSDSQVSSRCNELRLPEAALPPDIRSSARQQFYWTVVLLGNTLALRSLEAKDRRCKQRKETKITRIV